MAKRYLAVIVFLLVILPAFSAASPSQVRVSVFNFGTVNLDASGLGAGVTTTLLGLLAEDRSLSLMDRKELESFLGMNDLQQNDQMDNVVNIGNRLGINVIVVGTVEKKGSVIIVQCRVIQVEKKKVIFSARIGAIGDTGLNSEVRKLGDQIRKAIGEQFSGEKTPVDESVMGGPVGLNVKAGNRSVHLLWEAPSGAAVAGYEVFRATSPSGPYSRIAQVAKTEYVDETVEKDTGYHYKVRAFNDRGLQSEFSPVVEGKTALTPNPPVILKAEGRVKGVSLLWSPGPVGADPHRLKGYRLYRARAEQGPYREIVNVQAANPGDVNAGLDRLSRVSYLDKGLADGEDYFYRATAFNEMNLESGFSKPIRGTVTPQVGSLKAEGDQVREIRISWKPIMSPYINAYHVYRSTSPNDGFVPIKRVNAPSTYEFRVAHVDRDSLLDQTQYYYRITALEEGGAETSLSEVAWAGTRGKPPKPLLFRAVAGLVKVVDLLWAPAPAEEVVGYKLYRAKEKENQFVLVKALPGRQTDSYTDGSRTFGPLEDGTVYRYRLTTYNKVEVESEPTEIAVARTKPRPVKPTGVQGEGGKVRSVSLTWSPNPEKDIAQYLLWRSRETGEYTQIAQVREPFYLDQKLQDDLVYRYRIQAEDKDGLISEFSDTLTVRTKPKPATPAGINARVAEGKVFLSWREAAEPDVTHYTVYEKRLFGMEKIGVVREPRFSDIAPGAGKSKTYVITATDRDGLESDPSPEREVAAP